MASAGRDLRIKYSSDGGTTFVAVAGARTDKFTINREGIDITSKDDAGVRTMLAETGTFSVDASIEGVLEDDTILDLAIDPTQTTLFDFQIDVSGIGTITGEWYLGNFELTGEYGANAVTFTANLQSSGTMTYAAAP